MTAETTAISVDAIDDALATAAGSMQEDGQHLAAAVLRLLSAGEPVSVTAAATAAGIPESTAGQLLRSWPAVFWDDYGRVIGFWGLALDEMPHRIRRAGTNLYAWCAFDPLFLAGSSATWTSPPPTRSPARPSPTTSAKTAPSPALPTRTRCCRSCAPTSPGTTT